MTQKTQKLLVSIITPTYNEEEYIQTCLESLYAQDYKSLEIIVVDDGSSDQTVKIVSDTFRRAPKQLRTKLLQQKHLGPATARNKAAKQAKGKILVFVDADMRFEPDFISRLILPISQGSAIGTFSKEEYVANMEIPWARAWSRLRGFQEGRMHPENYPDEQAVYRAILKSEFGRVQGFDTSRGYDDDWSLAERLGTLAKAAPGAKFYHYNPSSPAEIFTQAKWMSKREYKLGDLGKILTLIRLNPIFSLIAGLLQAIRFKQANILVARLVYDMGQVLGLLQDLTKQNKAK